MKPNTKARPPESEEAGPVSNSEATPSEVPDEDRVEPGQRIEDENHREVQRRLEEGENDASTHDLIIRYRELGLKRDELKLKDDEQAIKWAGVVFQFLTLGAVVAGGIWGFYKFDHQRDVENMDRYRQLSQPYRETELNRLVRLVDAAGTIAARYPGDTEDPSFREAVRSFSNDFFSSKVLFMNARVEDAADDFALAAEHCTGEPVRGMPPQEPHPDGKCAACLRKLSLNLSVTARSPIAREWDQEIDPHLGNETDDCTNWAHQFRRVKEE